MRECTVNALDAWFAAVQLDKMVSTAVNFLLFFSCGIFNLFAVYLVFSYAGFVGPIHCWSFCWTKDRRGRQKRSFWLVIKASFWNERIIWCCATIETSCNCSDGILALEMLWVFNYPRLYPNIYLRLCVHHFRINHQKFGKLQKHVLLKLSEFLDKK